MIEFRQDPMNPDKLIVTQVVTIYLDKLLFQTLNDEVAKAIVEQAKKDIQSNPGVKKIIAKAATEKLLKMLGVDTPAQENSNG